ncbi:cyanophycinase [Bacillus sp. cl95]|uniref:cyanophycinase n=2 Tax=unclassified Bacillus (in: firmicutes) TaxID=185979 RepID=UPI0008F0C6E6|nr:cyanophycinase [Bacillus sp. cl95]SFB20683.1 cyanophycinase [Bacillus sp. UNCCL13]SFQ90893.1 cyanophycinase [Bacillus sp. cl95]
MMHKGELLIIGGNEDKYDHVTILEKFVTLAKIKGGKVGILTTATSYPKEVSEDYMKVFHDLGLENMVVLDVDSKEKSECPDILKLGEKLGALFITGGDQSRLADYIGGTKLHQLLLDKWEKGMLIAGTSAGASIMGKHMIVSSVTKDEDEILQVEIDKGFGLLPNLLIDQHFSQRARFDRLLGAIADQPDLMGIGIDENTAILVKEDRFEVLGEHQVLIIDGKESDFVKVSTTEDGSDELTLTNFKLHTLTSGFGFDLTERKLIKKENH